MDKNRLTRRDFLRGAALVGAGAALSACAQPTPEIVTIKETVVVEKEGEMVEVEVTRQVEVPVEVEVEVPVEVEVTAVPEAPGEAVTVVMWNGDPVTHQGPYNAMAEQFTAMQDEIIAESVNIAGGGMGEKLMAAIAADEGPDIYLTGLSEDSVKQGHIENLTPYIEADGILKDEWWFKQCYELLTYDGKQYGTARDVGWACWAYNVDLFDEMGVPYPEEGNFTQDDYVEMCIALTDKEKGTWGTMHLGMGTLLWGTAGYTWNLGFEIQSDDDREVQGYLDSEVSIAAIQHMLDLQVKYEVTPSAAELDLIGGNPYRAGVAGFGGTGTWEWQDELALEFNFQPISAPSAEGGGNKVWTWGDAVPYLMWSGSKVRPQAWEYMKFISGPVGSRIPHRIGMWTSPCPAVWEETASERDPRLDWIKDTQMELPYGRFPFDHQFFWSCVGGNYGDIWTRYVELGERPLEAIVQEQAELAQICLDDAFAEADAA